MSRKPRRSAARAPIAPQAVASAPIATYGAVRPPTVTREVAR